MIFIESIAVAIRALLINKLRSLLTMLGITIGIAAVLAMVAIGDGAKEIILEDLEKISGINVFTVLQTSFKWVAGRRVPTRSGEYLNYGDVLAIERECPSVQIVAPRIPEWSRVLIQFLSESILLCSIGGIFGVGLGVFASKGMAHIAVRIVKIVPEWPTVLSPQWILISVFFSTLLGVGFGLYPAIKAVRMSPIEALRTE